MLVVVQLALHGLPFCGAGRRPDVSGVSGAVALRSRRPVGRTVDGTVKRAARGREPPHAGCRDARRLVDGPRYSPRAEAFRTRVAAFLREHLPSDWQGIGALEGEEAERFLWAWRKVLSDNGLLGVAWPKEYGGGGLTKLEQVILVEECARAQVPLGPVSDTVTVKMMGNTILAWGTEEQKREFLPRILSGDDVWCQGYSEPEAGSDLAGLETAAVLDGDEWVIDGQKIWTSRAHVANWICVLARTDPAAAKHRGISFLMCRMDQPGVEVRPIKHAQRRVGVLRGLLRRRPHAGRATSWAR